tara:strand:- start:2053 stop:2577 length:525 start_codon:yes stop_codon:yes gene_type:complete
MGKKKKITHEMSTQTDISYEDNKKNIINENNEWGSKNILQKIYFALQGCSYGFKKDKSMYLLLAILITVLILSVIFLPGLFNKGIIIFFSFIALSAELINTSIEETVDRIGLEYNVLSKNAKDLSAAASLIIYTGLIIVCIFAIASCIIKSDTLHKNKIIENTGGYICQTFCEA